MEVDQNDTDIEEDDLDDWPFFLLEYMPVEALLLIFHHLEWQDLLNISQTCHRFRQLCLKATLWLKLKELDFTRCAIPSASKILEVVARCPNTECLQLDDVLIEQEEEPGETNIVGVDRFILNILRICPHLKSIYFRMQELTDRSVEAICAKCCELQRLSFEENSHISNNALIDILSSIPSLINLSINRCNGVLLPQIRHQDNSSKLNITSLSLMNQVIVTEQVSMLLRNCPHLVFLDLSNSQHLKQLPDDIPVVEQSGLDTLQTLILSGCDDLQTLEMSYCPKLRELNVGGCQVLKTVSMTCPELETVIVVGSDQLEQLTLNPCNLSNINLDHLCGLQNLEIHSPVLHSISMNSCYLITPDVLMNNIKERACLTDLSLIGCKNVPPADLSLQVLPQFPHLTKLNYGGHPWTELQISNTHIQHLCIKDCFNVTGFPLDFPCLTELWLCNCRDIVEQELLEGLLLGTKSPKNRKAISPVQPVVQVTELRGAPFQDNTGTILLQHLKLEKMAGIHGSFLSCNLHHFKHLTDLKLIQCYFLANLELKDCGNLQKVAVESSSKLNSMVIQSCPMLSYVHIKWCGMVKICDISANALCCLETTGTNFSNFSLFSDSLTELSVNGVLTQEGHSLNIRCPNLRSLTIFKCDKLTTEGLASILSGLYHLTKLSVSASSLLQSLNLPESVEVCFLMGHRHMKSLSLSSSPKLQHLTMNNLPKLLPAHRLQVLQSCEETLKVLELRAIPGETTLTLNLRNLQSLTLDQGIHLSSLEIQCPILTYLRIQGCPKLVRLSLRLEKLLQLNISHSSQLLALRSMDLQTTNVAFLAKVIAYYCPNVETLRLYKTPVTKDQITKLGHLIPSLVDLVLLCSQEDMPTYNGFCGSWNSSTLDRHNSISLNVKCESLSIVQE